MHHPVVPWVVALKEVVFDRVILPSVLCVDGFQSCHGRQTVEVKYLFSGPWVGLLDIFSYQFVVLHGGVPDCPVFLHLEEVSIAGLLIVN